MLIVTGKILAIRIGISGNVQGERSLGLLSTIGYAASSRNGFFAFEARHKRDPYHASRKAGDPAAIGHH
jgi:hypothetical protein